MLKGGKNLDFLRWENIVQVFIREFFLFTDISEKQPFYKQCFTRAGLHQTRSTFGGHITQDPKFLGNVDQSCILPSCIKYI